MSLFGGGADCGPVNPLQSLLKHSERDPSAQLDRFSQLPGQQGQHGNSMRTQQNGLQNSAREADMHRYFANQAGPSCANPFALDAMRNDLPTYNQPLFGLHSAGSSREGSATPASADWAKQFATDTQQYRSSPLLNNNHNDAWSAQFNTMPSQAGSSQAGPSMMPAGPSMMQQMPVIYPGMPSFGASGYVGIPQSTNVNGQTVQLLANKNRFVELDDTAWEAQFAKLEDKSQETAQVPASFQDDQIQEDPAAIQEAEDETDAEFLKNIERTWRNLKDTMDTSNLSDQEHAAWEAQYGTNFADLHDGYDDDDFATYTGIGLDAKTFDDWLQQTTSQAFPFEQENPFAGTFDPFEEGQRLLRQGNPLSEAALAFEEACRQNPHRGEAWRALGDTLAADEKEVKAIRALERAVTCPDGGGEGAWMSLAISYVNEGQDLRAYATLEKWITTAYPSVAQQVGERPSPEKQGDNPWSISTHVVDMFLAAARVGPNARRDAIQSQPVDADVQSGLGVLFYTNSDYARARDCFEAALSVRPDDFLLWNRLGATLANGGQPEEAIDAYRKALELRPTFTRAIYNLGVSCLNINCYREAAEHLLAALDLHRRDKLVGKGKGKAEDDEVLSAADGSDNLWHTLRRAFLCMERPDLADRARPGGDVSSFKRDGFEF